jgi:hypothetical protein
MIQCDLSLSDHSTAFTRSLQDHRKRPNPRPGRRSGFNRIFNGTTPVAPARGVD